MWLTWTFANQQDAAVHGEERKEAMEQLDNGFSLVVMEPWIPLPVLTRASRESHFSSVDLFLHL